MPERAHKVEAGRWAALQQVRALVVSDPLLVREPWSSLTGLLAEVAVCSVRGYLRSESADSVVDAIDGTGLSSFSSAIRTVGSAAVEWDRTLPGVEEMLRCCGVQIKGAKQSTGKTGDIKDSSPYATLFLVEFDDGFGIHAVYEMQRVQVEAALLRQTAAKTPFDAASGEEPAERKAQQPSEADAGVRAGDG